MLVEFSVKNFRSFKERQTISFVTNEKKDTINNPHPKVKNLNLVTSIMGPNASGKSNLILAIFKAQQIIIHSHFFEINSLNNIDIVPYALSEQYSQEPTEFEFLFILNNTLYQYGFAILDNKIVGEWLNFINNETNRENKLLFRTNYEEKENWYISPQLKGRRTEWIQETRENTLLLSIIGTLKNNELLKEIVRFFTNIFIYFPNASISKRLAYKVCYDHIENSVLKKDITAFLSQADLGIVDFDIEQIETPNSDKPVIKISTVYKTEEGKTIKFDIEKAESTGTKKLFYLAIPLLFCLKDNLIFIVDELDVNIHPNELKFIINLFKNKKNVQLIFTNHDVTVLDYLTKNEVYFVDKKNGFSSEVYPLTDYENRNDVSFQKRYLNGFYDALPLIKEDK